MVQEHCPKMSSIINVPGTAIFIPVSSFNGIFNGLPDFVFIKNDPQAGLMMTEDGLGDLQQLHCYVRALLWLDQFLDGFSRQQVAQNIYKRLCFKIFHAIKLYINMVSTVKKSGHLKHCPVPKFRKSLSRLATRPWLQKNWHYSETAGIIPRGEPLIFKGSKSKSDSENRNPHLSLACPR